MLSRTVRSWGSIPTSSSFLVPLNRQAWMCDEHCLNGWGSWVKMGASTRWCRFPVRYSAWSGMPEGLLEPAGSAVWPENVNKVSLTYSWSISCSVFSLTSLPRNTNIWNKLTKTGNIARVGQTQPILESTSAICTDLGGCLISDDGISDNEVKLNTWIMGMIWGLAVKFVFNQQPQTILSMYLAPLPWNFGFLHSILPQAWYHVTSEKATQATCFLMCSWRNQALKLVKKSLSNCFPFRWTIKTKTVSSMPEILREFMPSKRAQVSGKIVKKGDAQVVEDMRYYERKVFGAMNDWTQRI